MCTRTAPTSSRILHPGHKERRIGGQRRVEGEKSAMVHATRKRGGSEDCGAGTPPDGLPLTRTTFAFIGLFNVMESCPKCPSPKSQSCRINDKGDVRHAVHPRQSRSFWPWRCANTVRNTCRGGCTCVLLFLFHQQQQNGATPRGSTRGYTRVMACGRTVANCAPNGLPKQKKTVPRPGIEPGTFRSSV